MKQTITPGRRTTGIKAALMLAATLLAVLGCRSTSLAQNAPTGPAGGDLTGTYPNPTLAVDRVRKTGDAMTGGLSISLPNPGTVVTPFTIISAGNALSGRGTAMDFNVPHSAASVLGGRIATAWGGNAQTYMSFSAYNGAAMAEVFRLDGRGYVGVGTSNPTSKLHVVSGTDTGTTLLSLDTGVHGGTSMAVFGTANNESGFDMSVYRSGQYVSRLGVTNAGHVYFQPGGGNVGVGTTTPGYALDVVSSGQWAARFRKTDATHGGILVDSATGYNPNVAFSVNGAIKWYMTNNVSGGDALQFWEATGSHARLSITQGGAIGIGMLTPNSLYKLDVAGSVNTSGGLCIAGDCKTSWTQVGGGTQWTTSGTSVHYSTGSVGIGAAAPGARLDVGAGAAARGAYTDVLVGTGGNNPQMEFYGPTKSSAIAHDEPMGGMVFYTNGPAFSPSFFVGNNARVGVGTTSPGSQLFVGSGTPAGMTLAGLNVALGGNSYISASNGTINTFIGSDTSTYGMVGTLTNHPLGLRANNVLAVTVMPDGKVGIGTGAPTTKLHVLGDGKITGDLVVDGNIAAKYQDVAEWVPSTQKLAAGTVVVLDTGRTNHVVASASAYDTKVAGVVSAEPGVILGVAGEDKLKVATTGRVKVKVDATRGAIKVGDLLVTSDVEGLAMKSEPILFGGRQMHAPGTIIGKALEPLEKGVGEILVLLSLQ